MKIKLFLFSTVLFLTSCGELNLRPHNSDNHTPMRPTIIDREYSCTLKMIGELGVDAETAQRICGKIHRGR